jgi:hypothetical protein
MTIKGTLLKIPAAAITDNVSYHYEPTQMSGDAEIIFEGEDKPLCEEQVALCLRSLKRSVWTPRMKLSKVSTLR